MPLMPSLGGFGSGYFEGQDERLRRQMLQQQLQREQQQDSGLAALMQAYAASGAQSQQLPTPQMPPQMPPPGGGPGGAPAMPPGMPSQPPRRMMGPPGDGGMPPPQAPPGMMGPPPGAQRPAMPPPQRPQGPAPYTAPQAPQQPGPQAGGIPQPPAQNPMTQAVQSALPDLRTMADTLKKQGVTGMPLYYALMQHQNFLSAEGKQQLAMLQREVEMLRAQAQVQGAGTKERAEQRLEAREAGQTAGGAATIGLKNAQADAARARARKFGQPSSDGGTSGMTQQEIDYYAAQSLGGNDSWKTNFRGKSGQDFLLKVAKRVPELAKESGISPQEQGTNVASRKAYTAVLRNVENRNSSVELFSNKLARDMDSLDKILDGAAKDGPLFMNQPLNALRRQFQDPTLAKLDLQARQVGTEYERLITSGGLSQAQLHRGAQEDAKALINGDYSPERTRAVLDQIKVDIQNAKDAAAEEVSVVKGKLDGLGATKGAGGGGPKPGTVEGGYRFKGGDPSKRENWEKV